MKILFVITFSIILIINIYSVNAEVYTDEDLEKYKSNSDSDYYNQPERESHDENKSYSSKDNKNKHGKTKPQFSARGCEVVKFSPYNQTISSTIRKKGRIIQGNKIIDLDDDVVAHEKTKRCSSFTIRNTSYSYKVSPIIKATSADGKKEIKRIRIPKLNQNKIYSDKLCFEDLKAPIVRLECSF